MKRILLIIYFSVVCCACLRAQSTTTSFMAEGIKVIFKPTTKNVTNIRIYFRGGVTNYPAAQAGIENIALAATTKCGTNKYRAAAYRDTADKYGVLLSGFSFNDYGYIQVNCISKYFDIGWDLFAEAALNPTFESEQLDLLKKQALANIAKTELDPVNLLGEMQMKRVFSGTAYESTPIGTEATVSALTATEVAKYYHSILKKDKIFIVAVGNITKQELYEKIVSAFYNLPASTHEDAELKPLVWTGTTLVKQQRKLPIDYVIGAIPSPDFTSVDYVPFRLAVAGLGGNVYQALRTGMHLSYDPSAAVMQYKMPFAYMYASTKNPKDAILQMMTVLKNIQVYGYNEEWLQHLKSTFITQSFVNDQNSAQITNNLGLAEILGNWQYSDDLPQLVNMVTVEQVNRVINLYATGIKWTYLGNMDDIEDLRLPAY